PIRHAVALLQQGLAILHRQDRSGELPGGSTLLQVLGEGRPFLGRRGLSSRFGSWIGVCRRSSRTGDDRGNQQHSTQEGPAPNDHVRFPFAVPSEGIVWYREGATQLFSQSVEQKRGAGCNDDAFAAA